VVQVQQNIDAADTTGGIVWESAYLLLDYLIKSKWHEGAGRSAISRPSVLDLGAGAHLFVLTCPVLSCPVLVQRTDM
jgi:hypothetical protein